MDVYRTLGIQLPRNSAVQAKSLPSMASWTKEDTEEKRLSDLKMAKLGDILTMPGHVMLFLGFDQGDAYAIHAFVGYGERSEGGINQVWVNAVEVSNLAMLTRSGASYLQQLTGVLPVL
jgi:cell wall-associated NlpC family hydrolase